LGITAASAYRPDTGRMAFVLPKLQCHNAEGNSKYQHQPVTVIHWTSSLIELPTD